MQLTQIRDLIHRVKENVSQVIVGKEEVIDQLLISMIAGGHVLLEDVPGTGKTLLAKSLAKSMSIDFKRVQFTPDLLPSDLSGIHFFNQKDGEFEFRPGPLFTNLLLADEINRATPRTQSSLLECMEEGQVSIDGETHILNKPYLVIATQNPVDQSGTFPLPEAQMDRFLMKIDMGYPDTNEGMAILKRFREGNPLAELKPVASGEEIVLAQQNYTKVTVHDDMYRYLLEVVEKTRTHGDVLMGVSPRGSLALLRGAQVHAILQGRDFVVPDDIKALVKPILMHRVILQGSMRSIGDQKEEWLESLMQSVEVPAEPVGKG